MAFDPMTAEQHIKQLAASVREFYAAADEEDGLTVPTKDSAVLVNFPKATIKGGRRVTTVQLYGMRW